jgi:hypothetical protein
LLFVGWDWASTSHAVTLMTTQGAVIDRWTFAHTEHDLDTILARLASHGAPAELPVAIERSDGLVVARLLAAGTGGPHRPGRVSRRPATVGRRRGQDRPG